MWHRAATRPVHGEGSGGHREGVRGEARKALRTQTSPTTAARTSSSCKPGCPSRTHSRGVLMQTNGFCKACFACVYVLLCLCLLRACFKVHAMAAPERREPGAALPLPLDGAQGLRCMLHENVFAFFCLQIDFDVFRSGVHGSISRRTPPAQRGCSGGTQGSRPGRSGGHHDHVHHAKAPPGLQQLRRCSHGQGAHGEPLNGQF